MKPQPNMVEHIQGELRSAMVRLNISQSELARRAGVQQPTVSRALSGEDMKFSTIDRLAKSLDLKWDNINGLRLVPR